MTATSKKQMTRLVLWAIAWALALILSSILFKGNPIGDWIDAALYIGGITFWLWQSPRLIRHRC